MAEKQCLKFKFFGVYINPEAVRQFLSLIHPVTNMRVISNSEEMLTGYFEYASMEIAIAIMELYKDGRVEGKPFELELTYRTMKSFYEYPENMPEEYFHSQHYLRKEMRRVIHKTEPLVQAITFIGLHKKELNCKDIKCMKNNTHRLMYIFLPKIIGLYNAIPNPEPWAEGIISAMFRIADYSDKLIEAHTQ